MTISFDQGTHELAPLTAKEAAAQIGVNIRTLERYAKEGLIKKTCIKRRNYYTAEEVSNFLKRTYHDTRKQ